MANYPIIDKIHSCDDYRALSAEELRGLPAEIRSFLVEKVSKNGGHLASNLGVVELTMALHRAFYAPVDRIIFDVGHQAYVHKILSGRANQFDTLREKGGISGFPKRAESVCDPFETGHSSTSVSAAIGILRADKILGNDRSVVAVIGDGALSGGMCFEALNDAGQSGLPLIVVINDNAMSISRNVGAMSKHLYKIRSSGSYQRFKTNFSDGLKRIPLVGEKLFGILQGIKNRIKYSLIPNVLFEELGFTYLGPVDGHNVGSMTNVLMRAKELKCPVVVHALTVKGKGYMFAENDPERFHGIGSFDARTGKVSKPTAGRCNSAVFGEAMCELAEKDKRIAAITAAMPSGTGLSEFALRYPERFFDVGIAEEHAVTMAAGMASAGMRPVAAIYSTFLQRAYDQIIHDVCLQNLNVCFAIDRAGLVGEDGETHQGIYDIAFLNNLHGMRIMAPSTREELKAMLSLALTLDGPCAIRYNRGSLPDKSLDTPIEPGKWEEVKPIGRVTIIAEGRLVQTALNAAQGTDAGVINVRFIKPMDEKMLEKIADISQNVITLEDGIKYGGMGSAIKECLAGRVNVNVLGVGEEPIMHASITEQDEQCGISENAVRQLINKLYQGECE